MFISFLAQGREGKNSAGLGAGEGLPACGSLPSASTPYQVCVPKSTRYPGKPEVVDIVSFGPHQRKTEALTHKELFRFLRTLKQIIYLVTLSFYLRGRRRRPRAVMGKHPDLMVAHPTSTIFTTIGRNFEIS